MTVSHYLQDEDVQGKIHQSPARPGSLHDGLELSRPAVATTPIPLGFTTTRRPSHVSPRVKSNILQASRHRPSPPPSNSLQKEEERRGQPGLSDFPPSIEDNDVVEAPPPQPIVNPFDNPPFISVDGKKPRVKANINNKFTKNKINKSSGNKHKKQGSKRVELDRSQFHNINFISPTAGPDYDDVTDRLPPSSAFSGPEVRPDGRVPRVKADVLAAARDQGQPGPVLTTPLPRPTRPPPSQLFGNSVRPNLDLNTQTVSPSTVRNIFPPDASVNTPQPIFSSTLR